MSRRQMLFNDCLLWAFVLMLVLSAIGVAFQ